MQIIILGMHRSGTSAITRLINMMGAYFGPEGSSISANEHNAKGYWERRDFVSLNMLLLGLRGCTWYDLGSWGSVGRAELDPKTAQAMRAFLLELDAHRPWVLKDPRVCVTLADWLPILEAPLAVIASRDPLEIARSLEQREGLPIAHGLAIWEHYAVHTVRNSAALRRVFVTHEGMMTSPVETTRKLYDDLVQHEVRRIALPSDREILAFVEPKLHRALRADVEATLSEHQVRLNQMLRGDLTMDADIEVSPESRSLAQRQAPILREKLATLASQS